MAFTRPDNNKSVWRQKPDRLQDQSATVKADLDRLLNENTNDVLTLINELEALGACDLVASGNTSALKYIRLGADSSIEVSADGTNWQVAGSGGHVIQDKDGATVTQRTRMKFANSVVTDDAVNGVTIVNGIKGDKGEKGDIGTTGVTGPAGVQGPQGETGQVFAPSISNDGVLSWTLGASEIVPDSRNIKGPQGIQGVQGTQGAQGIQGIAGATGAQGPQGATGATGAAGADGQSFTVHGRYNTLLALQTDHPTGTDGDAWAVGSIADNDVYVWDVTDSTWKNIGPIVGPQGAQGVQGIQGAKGDTGAQGAQGAQGIQGIQGEQGIQGPEGAQGPKGDPTTVNGKTGASITLTASDVGALPSSAIAGFNAAYPAAYFLFRQFNLSAGSTDPEIAEVENCINNPTTIFPGGYYSIRLDDNSGKTTLGGGVTNIIGFSIGAYAWQMRFRYGVGEGTAKIRNQYNGTWTAWRQMIDTDAEGTNYCGIDPNNAGKIKPERASAKLRPYDVSITLDLTHCGCCVYMCNGSAVNVTIPADTSVSFPAYTEIEVVRGTSAAVTIVAASGVTIHCKDTTRTIADQYSSVCLKKTGTSEWLLQGNVG